MPPQSKVKQYQDHEGNFSVLSDEVFGKRPFRWQLEAAQAILCGRDVVLDIGNGSRKTLFFALPLPLNNSDLTVSPSRRLWLTGHVQVDFTFKCKRRFKVSYINLEYVINGIL
jgi:hypothetical protein